MRVRVGSTWCVYFAAVCVGVCYFQRLHLTNQPCGEATNFKILETTPCLSAYRRTCGRSLRSGRILRCLPCESWRNVGGRYPFFTVYACVRLCVCLLNQGTLVGTWVCMWVKSKLM